MSRGVFLLGIGIAVIALAFAVTDWVTRPTPGVTEANARRINAGMTPPQLEALLGRPPDGTELEDERGRRQLRGVWLGKEGNVIVAVDDHYRVERVEWR